MLYLIGGAPRLGKSILAERMHEKRGVPIVSTDDLYVELQGHTGMQFAHVMHLPTEDVVQQLLTEAHAIETPLQEFIEHHIETNADFILEGVHLLPSFISQYSPEVRSTIVVSTDRELVLSGLRSDTREENWMRGASEETQNAMADFVVGFSEEVMRQADEEGVGVFERTENLEGDLKAMMRLLR
jgi:2-phosphoglycerate kinase